MKHNYALLFTILIVVLAGLPVAFVAASSARGGADHQAASAVEEAAEIPEVSPTSTIVSEAETDVSSSETENPVTDDPKEPVESSAGETQEEEPEPAPEERVPLDKYTALLEVNPYVSGWLDIEGIRINDPVVYTPGSQNYFLHRDLDGTPLEKGTFFIAVNWYEGSGNTLIYGHNMKDGSGFGSLAKYADQKFGLAHPVIRFDTLYEDREYELLGAFYSQIDEEELETEDDRKDRDEVVAQASIQHKIDEGEATITQDGEVVSSDGEVITEDELTVKDLYLYRDFGDADIYRGEKDEDNGRFRYYYYTDLSDRKDFDYFISNVKERSLYDTGVEAEYGDEILTLSTCSYHVRNGRFIVVAVRHAL